MLDLLGTLAIGGTAGGLFASLVGALPLRTEARLALGAGIGAWIAVAVAAAASGVLAGSQLVLPASFLLPLVATACAAASTRGRAAMSAIPLPFVIGLNAMRVVGVLFLVLAATGRLAGPFPYSAGIGDIITGLFALPVARLAARNPRDRRIVAWNLFGALDLLAAVALGITSAPGSALQLIHAGIGSAAMTTLPWALIPLVLVPTYLVGHALALVRLRVAGEGRAEGNPALA